MLAEPPVMLLTCLRCCDAVSFRGGHQWETLGGSKEPLEIGLPSCQRAQAEAGRNLLGHLMAFVQGVCCVLRCTRLWKGFLYQMARQH